MRHKNHLMGIDKAHALGRGIAATFLAAREQMAAIMASGAASAEAERAAIGRTEGWFERRIGPITGTAQRRRGPAHSLAARSIAVNSTASTPPTTRIHSCSFAISSNCCSTIQLRRRSLGFPHTTPQLSGIVKAMSSGRSTPGPTRAAKFPIFSRSQSGKRARCAHSHACIPAHASACDSMNEPYENGAKYRDTRTIATADAIAARRTLQPLTAPANRAFAPPLRSQGSQQRATAARLRAGLRTSG
jgi:hypothetical protein